MKGKSYFINQTSFRKTLLFLMTILIASVTGIAQEMQALKGKISDKAGNGVIGVSVFVPGSSRGVISDTDGNYAIQAKKGETIRYSLIGMKEQSFQYDGRGRYDIVMEDDYTRIDEAVVIGYGVQKRASVTGAVSTMNDKEMLKAPSVGVSSVVSSRVAGISAVQTSGQPGNDATSMLIRGQSAVYVIDGIRRTFSDFNQIDPNEIESVSVLKDATSASVYGLDASAVVIVTTRQGRNGRFSISYTGKTGISENTNMLDLLNGPDYAYWYNKALELDASAAGTTFTPIFTQTMVQSMKDGTNGWGDTNWYKKTFGTGTTMHHNVSAQGGNDKIKFFVSLGAFTQDGNVDNFNFERYNIRSNVDAQITKNLSMSIDVSGRVEHHHQPAYSGNPNDWNNIAQQATRALPYVPETYTIDGVEYPVSTRTASSWVNPLAASEKSGYSNSDYSYIQTNANLKYDVPFVKGLSFKFTGSYDMSFAFTKRLSTPYKTAILTLPTAGSEKLSYALGYDPRGTTISLTESSSRSHNITTQTSANYENTFGKNKINAIVLAETREYKGNVLGATGYGLNFLNMDELDYITNTTGDGSEKIPNISGSSSNTRVAGFVGRLNYEYDGKYLAELSVRHDGSYLFSNKSGSRWVTLPGLSLGWIPTGEKWFHSNVLNYLKIRGGIGMTATSNVSAYQFLNLMTLSTNQVMIGSNSQSIVYSSTIGNPNLGWSKCLNYNVGVDFSMWNGLLGGELDAYYKYEYDILSSVTGSYSPSRGDYHYSFANENKKDYRGFDITLTHNNNIGSFKYGAKALLSLISRRWIYYAGDVDTAPDYQRLTGKEVGSVYGFLADGLFQSQEEIDNSALIKGAKVAPGYIKYKDRNGDGQISYAQDMGYVGKSIYPKLQGSFDLFANWKGFDIDMLWQWATGRSVALTGVYTATGSEGVMDNTFLTKSFYHGGNSPTFLLENAWTPENTDGEFPRPSITPLSSNNAYSSTFWYRNGDYLRLKSMQFGYSLPKKWMKAAGIESVRVYVEGSNLLTFSGLTKYNIDPEQASVNNGYYPQQKTYTFGVKLTF